MVYQFMLLNILNLYFYFFHALLTVSIKIQVEHYFSTRYILL